MQIARDDFGVCRIAAGMLIDAAEKAVKAALAVGAQSDAGEIVADGKTLHRLIQEREANEGGLPLKDRALRSRLARGLRLHAKDIAAKMEWEQANLFDAGELQARLNVINALVAQCEGREQVAA